MKILPLLIASAAFLYSCDKKESTSKEASEITTPANDSTKVADTVSENTISAPATAVAANPNEPQTVKSTVKPALNPAHGEPFHRCEIAVGAPIDSAPQQNAASQVMPQQTAPNNNFNTNPISPSVSASSAPVEISGPKPALNPAHGEPHHRCDLQVGAPLT